MKKYSTFSLCYLTKLTSLSVLFDDCVAFLVPCLGPYCWKHTLPMWSAYPFRLPQQSCSQDMKKYSTFSLCRLLKLNSLSVLFDDCVAFLVPCLGPYCWKHTLPMWSAYPVCLPQQSCCQDMKKYSTFSLCHLTKLSFLSVLCDDCEAFLVPCLGIDCWKHTLPKWSVYPLFSITKLLSGHEEIFHVFSLLSDEVAFSISFIRWLRSFSCSLPRNLLLKTHFA